MTILMTTIKLLFVWIVFGMGGYAYWWVKDFKSLSADDLKPMILTSLYGPYAWYKGWKVHRK